MAYDWVANELYVAVCRGGHLVVIGITVHTMKECNSNTLRNYYVPDSVELTINPFTRYVIGKKLLAYCFCKLKAVALE